MLKQLFKKIKINQNSLTQAKNLNTKNSLVIRDIIQKNIKIEIDEATNGEEAVIAFEKNLLKDCQNSNCNRAYKLIIMDIGMPIKDGFEASKEILQIKHNLKELINEE